MDQQPFQNRHVMLHVSSDPDVQKAFVRRYVVRGLAAFEGAMANHEREGVSGPFAYGASPSAADAPVDIAKAAAPLSAAKLKTKARFIP